MNYVFYVPFIVMLVSGTKLILSINKGRCLGKRCPRGEQENDGDKGPVIRKIMLITKKFFLEKWTNINKRRKAEVIDKEIYDAISFLRNIISIDRGKQMSTDLVIEQLSEREGVLQAVYIRMLSLLRLNKRKEAAFVMSEEVETPNGKEFAGLLLKWDEINPQELVEILLSHQKSIKELRITAQKHKDEIISDLLYFPVVINVVFIFINFMYVGYFISQKEILQTIL